MKWKSILFLATVLFTGCSDFDKRYVHRGYIEDVYANNSVMDNVLQRFPNPTEIRISNEVIRVYRLKVECDSVRYRDYIDRWLDLQYLIYSFTYKGEWRKDYEDAIKSDKRFKVVTWDKHSHDDLDPSVVKESVINNYGTIIFNNDSSTVNINK